MGNIIQLDCFTVKLDSWPVHAGRLYFTAKLAPIKTAEITLEPICHYVDQ